MTQMELAEQLNVSHQAISKWERGESLPDIGTILVLAKIFDQTIDDIMNAGATIEKREHQLSGLWLKKWQKIVQKRLRN